MEKKKVYFTIDDDSDDQLFLIEALTKNDSNIECFTAWNGKEALRDLKNSTVPFPDIIFLDLNMPQTNGKQFLSEIKSTLFLCEIPVIIYSTSSYKNEIQECLKLGAFSFMTKKSSFHELRQELFHIIAQINILKEAE